MEQETQPIASSSENASQWKHFYQIKILILWKNTGIPSGRPQDKCCKACFLGDVFIISVLTKSKKAQFDGISRILTTPAILNTSSTKETWPIYFTSIVMSLPASRIGRQGWIARFLRILFHRRELPHQGIQVLELVHNTVWNSNRAPTVYCYRLASYEWSILKGRTSTNHCNYKIKIRITFEARKATTVATSSGLPGRPNGCSSLHFYTLLLSSLIITIITIEL